MFLGSTDRPMDRLSKSYSLSAGLSRFQLNSTQFNSLSFFRLPALSLSSSISTLISCVSLASDGSGVIRLERLASAIHLATCACIGPSCLAVDSHSACLLACLLACSAALSPPSSQLTHSLHPTMFTASFMHAHIDLKGLLASRGLERIGSLLRCYLT